VVAIREQFGVSERRACRVVGQARSAQRVPAPIPTDEELALRAFLRNFSLSRPRWGWRRAAKAARDAGWAVNNKRVHRLWREEGLRVPYRKRKRPSGARGGRRCVLTYPAQRGVGPRLPVRPDH